MLSAQAPISPSLLPTSSALKEPRLPPELSDGIIDVLHSCPSALLACTLVCRTWSARARHHLFSSVRVDSPKRLYALHAVFNSRPELVNGVRQLTIESTPLELVLSSSLSRLPNLQNIRISNLHSEQTGLFAESRAALVHLCIGLKSVELLDVVLSSSADTALFLVSPNLESVRIAGLAASEAQAAAWFPFPTQPAPAPGDDEIRTLHLDVLRRTSTMPNGHLLEFNLGCKRLKNGRGMRVVLTIEPAEENGLREQGLSGHWLLGLPEGTADADIQDVVRELQGTQSSCEHMQIHTDSRVATWLPRIISDLARPEMERISLTYTGAAGEGRWAWDEMDAVLGEKKCEGLRSVVLRGTGGGGALKGFEERRGIVLVD